MGLNKIRWVIQNNLIGENDLKQIQQTCNEIGVEFQEIKVIPFSNELPDIILDEKINIYYGSTSLMNNVYNQLKKPIGLFYDNNTFSMVNYLDKWGNYMLNSEAFVKTVDEVLNEVLFDSEENVFVRPDGDGKEFDGQVMLYKDIKSYLERHLKYETPLSLISKILIGPAYNIHKEWRNYVVDGKIVTSSLYRENFKLKKSNQDIPQSMLDFTNERIKEYQPHKNFAIDIASTHDGEYYIIECGCLNSVGFYHCDISKLISEISLSINK